MREVTEDITKIETGHGNLRDDHLQERRECREHPVLLRIETKTGGSAKVASLHDAGRNKDLRMLLVDDLQTSRPLEIA